MANVFHIKSQKELHLEIDIVCQSLLVKFKIEPFFEQVLAVKVTLSWL